jgi:PTS system beta-glucosides-specific IIC component
MKYSSDAAAILEGVGGADNVESVYHCITRLRFSLRDSSKADEAALVALPMVVGVNDTGAQYQVVVGDRVPDVFAALVAEQPRLAGDAVTGGAPSGAKKGKLPQRFFDFIAGVFAPLLPAVAGTGLLKGLLTLLAFLGWVDSTSQTYVILAAIGDAAFYFLPVLVAMTAARKLEANPYVAVAIAGTLVYPGLITLLGAGKPVEFAGLPVTAVTYSYTVIPVLLAVYLMSWVERGLNRIIPRAIKLMVVPLITMVIVTPITLLLLGPLGSFVGHGISGGINWGLDNGGPVAGAIIGGLLPLIIMTGMHYALVPFIISNLATLGYDKFLPLTYVQTFATSGAALGVGIRAKSKTITTLALSTTFTGLMGVTEPALYGLLLPLRRPFIAAMIGSAVGGAVSLGFGVKAYVLAGNGGIPGLPGLIGPTFVWAIVGLALAFVVSLVVSLVLGFDESVLAAAAPVAAAANPAAAGIVAAPVSGRTIPLEQLPDKVFAQKIMGDGIAIVPTDGELVSPVDGTVVALFGTNHAVGLRTDDGLELLLHIGIDTVALGGRGFTARIAQGDRVSVGTPLISFDLPTIAATHDTSVIVVITGGSTGELVIDGGTEVRAGEPLLHVAAPTAAVAR